MKGCASFLAGFIGLSVIALLMVGLGAIHNHFSAHAEAIAAAQEAARSAARAAESNKVAAAERTQREANARAEHERRLALKRDNPAEYARGVAQARAVARAAAQQAAEGPAEERPPQAAEPNSQPPVQSTEDATCERIQEAGRVQLDVLIGCDWTTSPGTFVAHVPRDELTNTDSEDQPRSKPLTLDQIWDVAASVYLPVSSDVVVDP